MFRVTSKWIHRYPHKPPAGWTARQLKLLGVSWPPQKGWLSQLEGTEISEDDAREFERLSHRGTDPKVDEDRLNSLSKEQLIAIILEMKDLADRKRVQ